MFEEPCLREEARREWTVGADDFVCVFVGKLDEGKRPDDLIRAASLLDDARIVLVFVGTGPLEASCRRLVQELGVEGRFLGFLNQSELGRAYGVSDCLVLPSESESWGLVVNEAMATGLPCVVSDRVGCAPDLIDAGRTGEIYPGGDVKALSLALRRLVEERAQGKRRSGACLSKIRDYSYEAATRGLIQACVAEVSSL
jgi:glycosyltransferase involved in cell wall biosynthesis